MEVKSQPTQCLANHFPLIINQQEIYQYAVSYEPNVENRTARFRLLSSLANIIGKHTFDGSMLFLQSRLEDQQFDVANDGSMVKLDIKYTATLPPGLGVPLQLHNMMFRKLLRGLKYAQIGRNFFDPSRSVQIKEYNVDIWPGFFTAVHVTQLGVSLIADVAHKISRTDTVLQFMDSRRQVRDFKAEITHELVGQVVLTRYNNRTYRIDEIAWDATPKTEFSLKTGERCSYLQYYARAYKNEIRNLDQPLLLHKKKRKGFEDESLYLIPELCYLTGISDAMKSDFNTMKAIADHTRISPSARRNALQDLLTSIHSNDMLRGELASWNVEINSDMLRVDGIQYGPEMVYFGNRGSERVHAQKADWSNSCKRMEALQGVSLTNWLVVAPPKSQDDVGAFLNCFKEKVRTLGFFINGPPDVQELNDDRQETYLGFLDYKLRQKVYELVVVVLSSNKKERYDKIKYFLSVEVGVPSQCIVLRTLRKPKILESVCIKIALQEMAKMGAQLWGMDLPKDEPTMIVGIDICHDIEQSKPRSVIGFAATINSGFNKYHTQVAFQRSSQELITVINDLMQRAIRAFFEVNKCLPTTIVVYRDGVGDGMIPAVLMQEIPQFKDAFNFFGPEYKPKLSLLIVKKHIHTRIFSAKGENPTPGTVVEKDIIAGPENGQSDPYPNFFLVAQAVGQGTVTPTHCVILVNDTNLDNHALQSLTFKLTHMYYNWAGTIRVPAPCQYAHKLAFLVGQSLHAAPNEFLNQKLHFL